MYNPTSIKGVLNDIKPYFIAFSSVFFIIASQLTSQPAYAKERIELVVSKGIIDKDNDGIIDEFKGKKRTFSLKKDLIITLTAIVENCEENECKEWEISVYGPEAGISNSGELENEVDPVIVHPIPYLKEICGTGKYKAVLKIDREIRDEKGFKIKE
ncbi:hypothetical protein HZB88_03795 [archaeon]|nr:hypothetical protein [archaeon]